MTGVTILELDVRTGNVPKLSLCTFMLSHDATLCIWKDHTRHMLVLAYRHAFERQRRIECPFEKEATLASLWLGHSLHTRCEKQRHVTM